MSNARQHIFDIIDMPDRHQDHAKRSVTFFFPIKASTSLLRRYSASVVMNLAYGKNPKSYDDPDVIAVNRCLTRLGVTLRPGTWKVDIYPFLRHVIILWVVNIIDLTTDTSPDT